MIFRFDRPPQLIGGRFGVDTHVVLHRGFDCLIPHQLPENRRHDAASSAEIKRPPKVVSAGELFHDLALARSLARHDARSLADPWPHSMARTGHHGAVYTKAGHAAGS